MLAATAIFASLVVVGLMVVVKVPYGNLITFWIRYRAWALCHCNFSNYFLYLWPLAGTLKKIVVRMHHCNGNGNTNSISINSGNKSDNLNWKKRRETATKTAAPEARATLFMRNLKMHSWRCNKNNNNKASCLHSAANVYGFHEIFNRKFCRL